jgi:hypothetical protein
MKPSIVAALLCCCASVCVAQMAPRTSRHMRAHMPRHVRAHTLTHTPTPPLTLMHTPTQEHDRPQPVPCTDTNPEDLSNCGLVALGDGRYVAARQAWELAAWHGDYLGALWLGELYEAGKGVPRDDVHAYAWFDIAAELHAHEIAGKHAPASPALSTNRTEIAARDALAKKMTKSDIEKAQQLSRDWQKENPRA